MTLLAVPVTAVKAAAPLPLSMPVRVVAPVPPYGTVMVEPNQVPSVIALVILNDSAIVRPPDMVDVVFP